MTFSQPLTISDTSKPARRFMPWACSTRGNVYVGWYDRRAALDIGAANDLTDYFLGMASATGGGPLSAGPERNLTNNPDPHCASWRCSPRDTSDSESCTTQPQPAGFCLALQTDTPTTSTPRCDFSDGGCASGLTCFTKGGCPKYGDYNGIACATNWVIAAWASGTAPSGLPPASSLGVYASTQYVGDKIVDPCTKHPLMCVAPFAFGNGWLRVKCKIVPCIVVDPIPKNCTVKWSCPGCRSGGRCPPYYHIVFDESLAPWKVDLIDASDRQVPHELRRVGRATVLTFQPTRAQMREGEIADYRLVFLGDRGITPGRDYTIRARLEVSDDPVLDVARGRR
jgi:hypothetical protein